MLFDPIQVAAGLFGLTLIIVLFMKSSPVGTYKQNPSIIIHPVKNNQPKNETKQEEKTEEPPVPSTADITARAQFYQQEKKEEHLNAKEKSLDELQAEVKRKVDQAQTQVAQEKRDLKNKEYYLKQQEKLNKTKKR